MLTKYRVVENGLMDADIMADAQWGEMSVFCTHGCPFNSMLWLVSSADTRHAGSVSTLGNSDRRRSRWVSALEFLRAQGSQSGMSVWQHTLVG